MQEYPGSTTTQHLIVKQFCICYSTHAHAHTVPANNFKKLQRQIPATNFRIQFNLPPPKPTFTQFNSFISQQSRWIPKTLIFRFLAACVHYHIRPGVWYSALLALYSSHFCLPFVCKISMLVVDGAWVSPHQFSHAQGSAFTVGSVLFSFPFIAFHISCSSSNSLKFCLSLIHASTYIDFKSIPIGSWLWHITGREGKRVG